LTSFWGEVALVRPELGGDLQTILDGLTRFVSMSLASRDRRSWPTQTTPMMRSSPPTRVPRASVSIVPSTCSWASAKQLIQNFILAEEDAVKAESLEKLVAAHKGDFLGMFKAMDGKTRSSVRLP